MYRDKTLIPTEAIRLAALGVLAGRPDGGTSAYADLAVEVRHFASRIMGPSLDVLGPSVELLRHEGLVRVEEDAGEDERRVTLTEAGRDEFFRLLQANIRAPVDDLNKLVIALKFRFLHLLPKAAREEQLDLLIELFTAESERLADLRAHHAKNGGGLIAWLDHDIAQAEERIAWLKAFKTGL